MFKNKTGIKIHTVIHFDRYKRHRLTKEKMNRLMPIKTS
jgi:hypothetical protein